MLRQASYNAQQKAEIKRGQKEADQGFRQMYANCLKTIELQGSFVDSTNGLLDKAFSLALVTPAALLIKSMDPRELLGHRGYVGMAEADRSEITVHMYTDTRSVNRSIQVTVKVAGLNQRLVINKRRDYAEIYSNDPVNLPTQYQEMPIFLI